MAMHVNGEDNEISNINITPMVDIMLVLLVIFMVTADFIKMESLNINLPKVSASDPNVARSLNISLLKNGKIIMEGTETDRNRLIAGLGREVKFRPNMRVTLSADEGLYYGNIAEVMGVIRKAGVSRIALSVKR